MKLVVSTFDEERVKQAIEQAVVQAFKLLLSEKHLYQYAEVDLGVVRKLANEIHEDMAMRASEPGYSHSNRPSLPSAESIIADVNENEVIQPWLPGNITATPLSLLRDTVPITFNLPTINTFCDTCKKAMPFKPVSESSYFVQGQGQNESFYLGYQCQQCDGKPILFLVCREGLKLRLAGRYPIEVLPTPKVLPKDVSKYYSNALIAHHAGQTLAGLFLLRVFIEQFWRTVPAVQELIKLQPRATGDEQGDAYQSALPSDFKSRFPSLKDVYGELSKVLHSANEDAKLFDESCVKIVEHFDARRLYKIKP